MMLAHAVLAGANGEFEIRQCALKAKVRIYNKCGMKRELGLVSYLYAAWKVSECLTHVGKNVESAEQYRTVTPVAGCAWTLQG